MLVNTLYELEAYCTGVIARDLKANVLHGRVMDFDFSDDMRKGTYNARFVKGGKPVFDAVMFAGTVGVYTGVKYGGFGITLNERTQRQDELTALKSIYAAFTGVTEVSWLVRDTLTQCADFQCAYNKLKVTQTSSKCYFILSGIQSHDGVVITKSENGVDHEDKLSNGTAWFLRQTNSDHWREGCNDRCAAADKDLSNVGQLNITQETLRTEVLEHHPVTNSDSIYIATFSPAFNNSLFSEPVKYTNTTGPSKKEKKARKSNWNGHQTAYEIFRGMISDYFYPTVQAAVASEGLKIEVVKKGTGLTVKKGQQVTIHYTGRLVNGTVFDSSVTRGKPFTCTIGVG